MKKKKGRIGSSFDDFLKDEGIYEEVTARAIKRVIARQLDALMEDQGLTKSELAKRMKTSRAQLDRLLDPENESVTLGTLTRAARAVGGALNRNPVPIVVPCHRVVAANGALTGFSAPGGITPFSRKARAAISRRRRVRVIIWSDGARCSNSWSTIPPMLSVIAWSCRWMPSIPL